MKLKRITALVLAIVMTIGMFPVYTSAQEGASTAPTVTEETVAVTAAETVAVTEETVAATAAATETAAAPTEAAVTQAVAAAAPAVMSVAASYQENVGKRARFNLTYSNFPIVSDPTAVKASGVFGTEISISKDVIPADLTVKIIACYVNEAEGLCWYQIQAAEGCTLPAEFPAEPWVFQNYVNTTDGDSLIILPDPVCEICGSTNCTAEHILCGICGGYDCAALHFYCDICKDYDCGRDHLYCNLCGVYDCARDHVWCGTCGSYDCGLEHEEWDAPVTAPVIPENPTLAEGEAVSIVDAEGSPVEGLLLRQGEKTSLSAWSDLEGASYQWQVCYDSAGDLWVDIQGQTGKGILISPAMFLSILDAQGTAAVRCVMTSGEELRTSVAIPVTVGERDAVYRMSASSTAAMAEAENPDELDKDYVVVQYVYSDGRTAASSDFATIIPGQAYSHSYALPVVTGYAPSLNTHKFGEKVKIENGKLVMNLAAGDLTDDYTIFTVTYSPDYVNYTVIHYWQNVDNDNYTEHERQTISTTHRTGEVIADAHKTYPGFYNLLYETPAAAADGSTVIEVYYDRYYYLMKFDLDGGYGVDPIYARYGTELEVPNPTRPGYSFDGWTPNIPDTLPVGDGTYQAQWTTLGNTPYTVAYWIINADGTKSLLGNHTEYGVSGTTVDGKDDLGENTLTNRGAICGEPDHTHTADCFSCGKQEHEHHQHTIDCYAGTLALNGETTESSNEEDWKAIVAVNDGKTPENGTLYFIQSSYDIDIGRYWPKIFLDGIYHTITVNGQSSINNDVLQAIVDGDQINQATATYRATQYKAKLNCDLCGDGCSIEEHTHGEDCTICKLHVHTEACYQDTRHLEYVESRTDKDVEIKGDGSAIVNVYYQYKEYTLKFYYAASETGTDGSTTYKIVGGSTYYFGRQNGVGGTADGPQLAHVPSSEWGQVDELPTLNATGLSRNYTKGSLEYSDVTYYYISFKARYGDDISNMWPCAVFNSVTRTDKNNDSGWSGTEAFVSAWNGEHHVKYSQDNGNETIKGIYEKLDDNLLFASKYDDEQEVSYLCFWENGANINWSIPELYIYNIWLPCVGNQESTAPEGAVKKFEDNIWYYRASTYNTVDDSDIANQTNPALEGYSFRIKKWKPHFIADTQLSQDEKYYYGIKNGNTENKYDIYQKIVWSGSWEYPGEMKVSTKDQGSDRYLLHSPDYDPDNPGEVINHALYKEAYTVDFYYTAQTYRLSFWNHDGYLVEGGTGSQVAYKEPLLKYFEGITVNGTTYDGANDLIAKEEYYPDTLEPGAYAFDGWYTSAQFLDGTKVNPATDTMPAEPLMVYAKWVPVTRQVRFFLSQTSAASGLTIPAEMEARWNETYGIAYPSDSPYDKFGTLTAVTNNTYLTELSDPGVAEGYEEIHPYTGYEFLGWFYVNEEGEEAAFDPTNIPVTQDLDLYAKWSSNKLCQYNVYFALDADGNGTADVDEKGNTIYIADPISGSAIAGRTYTFSAKGGEELYDGYQEGYFPSTGSHSIVIDIADEDGTGANSFTFLYKPKTAVPYTVRYLDKDTGVALFGDKVVSENKNVVVTENYLYKQGYMPDAYQKTLVVSDDGVAGNDVIVFYYTKDEQHALYVVNHYIQDLNADLTHGGWSKYTDLQYTGDIGTAYSAEAIAIDGFTLSKTDTDNYNITRKINGMEGTALPTEVSALSNGKLSGTLGDKGMELNFYYTRNLYPYEFRYMLNGTTTELAARETGKAPFDTVVTMAAKEIEMDLDGDGINEDYRLYDPTETTKDIHIKVETGDTAVVNIATFYYVRCTQTMTITKTVVDNGTNTDPDPNQVFNFSLLIHAKNGYHRNSYDYRKSDGTTGSLSPEVSAPNTLRFALKAGETITIEGLPTAEYTVSELDLPAGYYDSYSPAQKNKLTVDEQLDVTVTNSYEPAILKISKAVDVVETGTNTPEVQEFVFTVAFPEGAELKTDYTVTNANGSWTQTARARNAEAGTVTVVLEKGWTAQFENLPLGTYTVTEEDYSAQGYNSYVTVNGGAEAESRTASVELARGDEESVVYRNLFPVGDLVIEKSVTKEFYGTPWVGDTFTFTVERTTSGRPLINGNQYTVCLDGAATGTAKVVAENKLQVTIEFSDADARKLDEKTEANSSVTHTLTIKNLPAGTYSVTEAEDADYVQTPAGLTVTGLTLPSENEVKAAFANQLIRPTGNLQVSKEIVLVSPNSSIDQDKKFTFEVDLKDTDLTGSFDCEIKTGTGDPEQSILSAENGILSFELKHSQTILIKNLPIGDYEVRELAVEGYDSSFGDVITQPGRYNVDPAVITEGNTTVLNCQNAYPVYYANLIIKKSVATPDDYLTADRAPEGDAFRFRVTISGYSDRIDTTNGIQVSATFHQNSTDTEGTEQTLTFENNTLELTLEHGQWYDLNLPVCTYTVEEISMTSEVNTTGALADYYTVSCALDERTGQTSMSSDLVSGETETVVFTNTYKRHLTELTITKTGASTLDENQSFVFNVASTSLTYGGTPVSLRVVITIPAGATSGSVTLTDMPLGAYTIAEEENWSWRYNDGSATITLGDQAAHAVTISNTRTNPYWLSGADANKNIFDGTP